jgi:Zn finger protein HypA/HybF involved in hydrogenase expression
MFYVKQKFSEGAEINIYLDYDNVYTHCPRCGVEHCVDISELVNQGFDIVDTRVYCKRCSNKNVKTS